MLDELRRFHKLSINTETTTVGTTHYGFTVLFPTMEVRETKFQILFKMLVFFVRGRNRNESIIILADKKGLTRQLIQAICCLWFTSPRISDNRPARSWMIKLTDWTIQR